MTEIKFLCDGRARCSQEEKAECFVNGGSCRHTNDIRHAKNFQCYYWQRIKELTAEFDTTYVEKEPQLDIEAVTTDGTNIHKPILRRIK